jgi:hypothetical protein
MPNIIGEKLRFFAFYSESREIGKISVRFKQIYFQCNKSLVYGKPAMICSNGRFSCMVKEPSDNETFTLSGYSRAPLPYEPLTILKSK